MIAAMSAPAPEQIRAAIGELLDARAPGKTICPSDVARALRDDGWRELMDPVRAAGRAMAAAGELEVTQRGRRVDPEAARGAIRYRRP
jgi:Protein of unknown function (DUF3253)